MPRRTVWVLVLAAAATALPAHASDALQWSGFALLRAAAHDNEPPPEDVFVGDAPLDDDSISAQLQLGIDWVQSPRFGAHVHLLARSESDHSRRGRIGIVQAYLDQNIERGAHRLRLTEGAFFLPTSRENVDALWESPYTITPSALNSWLGEEFRPIGFDVSWRHRLKRLGALTGGATVYRGNDTFGALPIDRGWALTDRWALLGEHVRVNDRLFTSVSAETDGRLGWSTRAKWNNDRGAFQITRIDNRSDARQYGDLLNWATR